MRSSQSADGYMFVVIFWPAIHPEDVGIGGTGSAWNSEGWAAHKGTVARQCEDRKQRLKLQLMRHAVVEAVFHFEKVFSF